MKSVSLSSGFLLALAVVGAFVWSLPLASERFEALGCEQGLAGMVFALGGAFLLVGLPLREGRSRRRDLEDAAFMGLWMIPFLRASLPFAGRPAGEAALCLLPPLLGIGILLGEVGRRRPRFRTGVLAAVCGSAVAAVAFSVVLAVVGRNPEDGLSLSPLTALILAPETPGRAAVGLGLCAAGAGLALGAGRRAVAVSLVPVVAALLAPLPLGWAQGVMPQATARALDGRVVVGQWVRVGGEVRASAGAGFQGRVVAQSGFFRVVQPVRVAPGSTVSYRLAVPLLEAFPPVVQLEARGGESLAVDLEGWRDVSGPRVVGDQAAFRAHGAELVSAPLLGEDPWTWSAVDLIASPGDLPLDPLLDWVSAGGVLALPHGRAVAGAGSPVPVGPLAARPLGKGWIVEAESLAETPEAALPAVLTLVKPRPPEVRFVDPTIYRFFGAGWYGSGERRRFAGAWLVSAGIAGFVLLLAARWRASPAVWSVPVVLVAGWVLPSSGPRVMGESERVTITSLRSGQVGATRVTFLALAPRRPGGADGIEGRLPEGAWMPVFYSDRGPMEIRCEVEGPVVRPAIGTDELLVFARVEWDRGVAGEIRGDGTEIVLPVTARKAVLVEGSQIFDLGEGRAFTRMAGGQLVSRTAWLREAAAAEGPPGHRLRAVLLWALDRARRFRRTGVAVLPETSERETRIVLLEEE